MLSASDRLRLRGAVCSMQMLIQIAGQLRFRPHDVEGSSKRPGWTDQNEKPTNKQEVDDLAPV
jgi:hypothetical protein